MLNGICPSCGSATVHTMESGVGYGGGKATLSLRGSWNTVESQDYVCATCGYFEKHFPQGKMLNKVAAAWPRVTPTDRTPPNPV